MVFVQENRDFSQYKEFIKTKFLDMRDLLPEDVSVVQIFQCLGKCWERHNLHLEMSIEEIMQQICNEWIQEAPQRHWDDNINFQNE